MNKISLIPRGPPQPYILINRVKCPLQVPILPARVRARALLRVRGLQRGGALLGLDRVGPVGGVLGHLRRRRPQEQGARMPTRGNTRFDLTVTSLFI